MGLLLLVMAVLLRADGTQLLVPAAAGAAGHGSLSLFRVGQTCLVLTPEHGHDGQLAHYGQFGHDDQNGHGHVGHAGHAGRAGHAQFLWELRRWYYRDGAASGLSKKLWHRIRTSQRVRHSMCCASGHVEPGSW